MMCFIQVRITHFQVKCYKQKHLNSAMQCLLAVVNVEIQALVQFRL